MTSIRVTFPQFALRRYVQEITDGPFGSSLTSSHYSDSGARVIRLGNIGLAHFKDADCAYIPLNHFENLRRHEVHPGDLIIAGLGDGNHPVGRACVAPRNLGPAIVKADCFRVRLDESRLVHQYAAWALSSSFVTGQVSTLTRGSTRARINLEMARDIRIPVPSIQEQQRIIQFLEAEIGKINDLVTKKQRLVSLMDERIDSRVLQHVGASLLVHPSTGKPVLPIRRALLKVVRPAVANAGVITAYRDGQVTERGLRRVEGYTLAASTDPQGQSVRVGDVVVHGLDGFAGAIGTSEAFGNSSPVYHVCVPVGDGNSYFLSRLLRLLALQGYLGNFATSTRERAVDFRNWDLFGRIPIPAVPCNEQQEIGDWVMKLRPLREAVERSEALATERRRALITAAVTGQFDVSTASGRNVTEGVGV
ncbi:restriction endonuclease subunit S [Streptomyces jietaisiensis]|uniref:restriction endonuclease subunit S n=1 Tax=Streptomyces griseoaurantiacus TaxID=68213 RepID=UPI002E376ABF|nr:restriction endonuclease subunit S [Streptomyces jietaisiensis]